MQDGVVWADWWGGARARGLKMGTGERSRCSHPRRTPGLCANLGNGFSMPGSSGSPGCLLSPVLSPARLAVWTQTSSWLWKEAEIFLPEEARAQNFRADFGEWTFDTETQTDRGLPKATQQGQVSQGLTLHIWLKSLQHFSYPRAVNSWRGRPLFGVPSPSWKGFKLGSR